MSKLEYNSDRADFFTHLEWLEQHPPPLTDLNGSGLDVRILEERYGQPTLKAWIKEWEAGKEGI